MMIEHRVSLFDPNNNFVADISNFVDLQYGRAVNEVGSMSITLSRRTYTRPIFELDRDWIIRIYRKNGQQTSLAGQTYWLLTEFETGGGRLTIKAEDAMTILNRRLVAYHSDTVYELPPNSFFLADVYGGAEDGVHTFVGYNFAYALDTTRNTPLKIQPPTGGGATGYVEVRAEWRKVLDAARECAEKSTADPYGADYPVYFDMLCSESIDPVFATFVQQRGRNLIGSGLVFSRKNGLLVDPKLQFKFGDYADFAYVGGRGQGPGRLIQSVPSDNPSRTPYGRTEIWVDARESDKDYEADDFLGNQGRYELKKRGRKAVLTGRVAPAAHARWGKDFDYGDRVEATEEGYSFECHFSKFSIQATQDAESLDLAIYGEKYL